MKSMRLPKAAGGFLLEGRSRAADATAFSLPELNWMLDCGAIIGAGRPERVFITHTHCDHANRVTHVVSRTRPPTIYVPKSAAGYLEDYVNAMQAMTDNRPVEEVKAAMAAGGEQWTVNRRVEGVEAGDCLEMNVKGKSFRVQVLPCDHTVDCVGYAFYEVKQRLKSEFKGLRGKELGLLRKEGVILTEALEVPLFAFMGDTTTKAFQRGEEQCTEECLESVDGQVTARSAAEPLRFPVVITECTFLDESEAHNAARTCHTLWSELEKVIVANPQTLFVLIHFSLRYKASYVHRFFAERKAERKAAGEETPLENIVLWLPDEEAEERYVVVHSPLPALAVNGTRERQFPSDL